MNKGFTLIEMLVVVLIIGVLAAIAVPQYEASIEKSRVAEALVLMKSIADAEQRYFQANPNETTVTKQSQIADVDLKGGCWAPGKAATGAYSYRTRNFTYDLGGANGVVTAYRIDRTDVSEDSSKQCATATEQTGTSGVIYTMAWGPYSSDRSCDPKDPNDESSVAICSFVKAMSH